MIDPRQLGFDSPERWPDALIVAFVDNDLAPEAGAMLAAEAARSPGLALAIERARCLRTLVATLPRVAVPETVRTYTAHLAAIRSSAAPDRLPIEVLLRVIPRRSAPASISTAVFARVRTERARLALADRRRSFRPDRAILVRSAVAALLLLGVSIGLFASRTPRPVMPQGSQRFVFDISMARPGTIHDSRHASSNPVAVPPARPVDAASPSSQHSSQEGGAR